MKSNGATPAARRRLAFCPFVSDDPGQETRFPQMSGSSSSASFKSVYWRCMTVLFASLRRYDQVSECAILTNVDPRAYCPPDIIENLRDLRVSLTVVDRAPLTRPAVANFGNVLFMIDALEHLHESEAADAYMCLDPDCVFIGDVERIWQAAAERGPLFYDVGTGPGEEIAGLTLDGMRELAERSGWELKSPLRHVGGEFLALSQAELGALLETIRKIRAADTAGVCTMEEHFLTFAIALMGLGPNAANDQIRRIWTGPRRKNACPDDRALTVWHAPREKQFGFDDLYRDQFLPAARGWTRMPEEQYREHLAERLGIPHWSFRKWSRDFPRLVSRKFADRAQRKV